MDGDGRRTDKDWSQKKNGHPILFSYFEFGPVLQEVWSFENNSHLYLWWPIC